MKKVFFLCAFICAMTTAVFSQTKQKFTNQEILNMLNKSMEVNEFSNGVFNPDLIYPGHQLTFMLQNGAPVVFPIVNKTQCGD